MHVDQALELVRAVPGCNDILTIGLLPTEGDEDPAPAVPPANPMMEQALDHTIQDTPRERSLNLHVLGSWSSRPRVIQQISKVSAAP